MSLSQEFLGNTVLQWVIALGIAIGCYLLLLLLRRLIVKRLVSLSRATQTNIDDLISEVLSGTRAFFLLVVSVNLGSRALSRTDAVTEIIGGLTLVAVLLQIGLWASRAVRFLLTRSLRSGGEEGPERGTMLTPLMFLIQLVIWSVVLLVGLDNFGVDITALITGLGIGGVAIALALQTVLGDLFASLSIALDKPFVIGDSIVVDDFSGTVEHVGLKTTRVRSLSGEQVIFSNSDLLKSRIRNFKRMTERRALLTLGVIYETPQEKLARIPALLKEIVERTPKTRFERSHFKTYGEFSLSFETVYFVLSPDFNTFMDTQQAVNLEVCRRFAAEGIQFAYPTQRFFLSGGEITRKG